MNELVTDYYPPTNPDKILYFFNGDEVVYHNASCSWCREAGLCFDCVIPCHSSSRTDVKLCAIMRGTAILISGEAGVVC